MFGRNSFLALLLTITSAWCATWDDLSNGRHSFRRLGKSYSVSMSMKRPKGARLVLFNYRLAEQLGLSVPKDPKELEKLVLDHFAWVVDSSRKSPKDFFSTYYQDSDTNEQGAARGDGRMVWTGEIQKKMPDGRIIYLDVTLKGIGRTPMAWTNHSNPGHSDGIQGMDEAMHSYIMSEASVRNQLDSTVDLAVIELPDWIKEKTHSGVPEKGAITIRIGNQTRIAHLRNFVEDPIQFRKILDYVIRRDLNLPLETKVTRQHFDRFRNQFVDNLAVETARYYDLHAIHGAPTGGNRTTQGSTIDLSTFKYLDAHHSGFTYLFDRRMLGGEFDQIEQMSKYISNFAAHVLWSHYQYPISAAQKDQMMSMFKARISVMLETLLFNRLGLSPSDVKQLSPETRTKFVKVVREVFEATGSRGFDVGWKTITPAAYDPREILKNTFRVLQSPRDHWTSGIRKLFQTDRSWRSHISADPDFQNYLNVVTEILSELKLETPKPEWVRRAERIGRNYRQEVGKTAFEATEGPLMERIRYGEEFSSLSARAERVIQSLVDEPLPVRERTQFGEPYPGQTFRFPARLKSRNTDRAAVRMERAHPENRRARREARDARAR
jgi:uncharacterized protein YdiU (UPF0061 family)